MKAPRLRVGLVLLLATCFGVAFGSFAPRHAAAEGDDLTAALEDYAAGRNDQALEKLRTYVQSNPEQEEVYAVLRDVEHTMLLNAMAKGGEHEKLIKYLLGQARPAERAQMNDDSEIRSAVQQAVQSSDVDARRSAQVSLRRAGELAVPHLIPHLASEDAGTVVNAIQALRQIHSDGTLALAEAMSSDDARVRMYTASVLGHIGDDRASPALQKALDDDDDSVRAKAGSALEKMGGISGTTADAYVALGQRFYDEDPGTVRAFSDIMNMWRWEDGGLARYEVPAYLYGYQMAEESAADALAVKPDHNGAAALLVRSILAQRVEGDALADHGEEAPESLAGAMTLAKSLGYRAASDALQASLDGADYDVAVACCDLVAATYGGENLDGSALSAALNSPERRVAFSAAIAALHMSPSNGFGNASLVASLAAQAANSDAVRQALVIDDDDATRGQLTMALDGAGYVVGGERMGTVGANRAKSAPTLDVIVIRANNGENSSTLDSQRHDSSLMVLDELSADARTKGMRIIVLLDEGDEGKNAALKGFYSEKYGDKVTAYLETPLVDSVVVSEIGAAAEAGDLGPDRERANALAEKAASAFAAADVSCGVFDYSAAATALSDAATAGATPGIRLAAVKALGNLQVGGAEALHKALTEGDGDELKAAAASALGNVLAVMPGSDEQIASLIEIAKGEGDVAQAALEALGQVSNLSAEQRLEVFRQHRLSVSSKSE